MIPTQPHVTILLPFYEVGEEFNRAIASMVNQSFSDWKLLLISNNGKQQGLEMAKKWVHADNRIKLLDEPEQGIAHALNTGLYHCSSPYVARMDADDISHPDRISTQFDFLENNPDIDAVSSQTSFKSNMPGSKGFSIFVNWQNHVITQQEHDLFRFIESPLAHPSIMFRKKLIDAYGPYSVQAVPEDYELWLRWMDQGVKFYKIPQPLLTWNDHANRLTRTHNNYAREAFFQVKCKYLAKWIESHVPAEKKILVCGSSRIGRKRAAMLQDHGIHVFGFTDVRKRPNRDVNFIKINDIKEPNPWFLINFIARRGVGQAIRTHFVALGFREGTDFILAA